jgi:hypothetical protein
VIGGYYKIRISPLFFRHRSDSQQSGHHHASLHRDVLQRQLGSSSSSNPPTPRGSLHGTSAASDSSSGVAASAENGGNVPSSPAQGGGVGSTHRTDHPRPSISKSSQTSPGWESSLPAGPRSGSVSARGRLTAQSLLR